MKTIFLTAAVWALTGAVSYGQPRALEKGSVEAARFLAEAQRRSEARKAAYDKDIKFGRSLFGADERWFDYDRFSVGYSKSMKVGTLKNPTDFKVGDWGCTSTAFRVIGKVSDTECLVLPRWKGAEVMLIRRLDMSKVTDGAEFILQHPVVIQGTYSYAAVSGAEKTVLVLECNASNLDELIAKASEQAEAARKAAEDALFRNWTDSTGKFSVTAKFIELRNGRVHLERRDDKKAIDIPVSRLGKEDKEWIREKTWPERWNKDKHTWKDNSSNSVEAVYDGYLSDGKIRLLRKDKTEVIIHILKLSEPDRLKAVALRRTGKLAE